MKNPGKVATYLRGLSRLPLVNAVAAITIGSLSTPGIAQEQARKGYNLHLEEIVVTAQLREENYLTDPITVNELTDTRSSRASPGPPTSAP